MSEVNRIKFLLGLIAQIKWDRCPKNDIKKLLWGFVERRDKFYRAEGNGGGKTRERLRQQRRRGWTIHWPFQHQVTVTSKDLRKAYEVCGILPILQMGKLRQRNEN